MCRMSFVTAWVALHVQRVAFGIDALRDAAERTERQVRIERGDLKREAFGQRYVVRIHPRDELSARHRQQLVACRDQTPIHPADDPHAGLRRGERVEDARRTVGRAIVDDDDLEIAVRLLRDALQRIVKKRARVEDRHEHADARDVHRHRVVGAGDRHCSMASHDTGEHAPVLDVHGRLDHGTQRVLARCHQVARPRAPSTPICDAARRRSRS